MENRKLSCDLITVETFGQGAGLSRNTSDRTQGHGRKLQQGKFKLNSGKRLLTGRVVVTGTGFLGKAPSLSEFRGHLDDVLSHTV